MKLKLASIVFFFLSLFFGFIFTKPAFADTFTISGNVSDSIGTNVENATVDVIDSSNSTTVVSTTTNSEGNYTTLVNGGTYNVQVTPPAGSGFSSAIALNQNISSDKTLNFALVPAGTIALSGHVYDALGNFAPGITIQLWSNNGQTFAGSTTTDNSGNYSVAVSPGTYTIFYIKSKSNLLPNFPDFATIFARNYVFSQSTVLDITFPLKRVQVHVQDSSGNPVSNVGLNTTNPNIDGGLNIGGGITNASGNDQDSESTDALGDAILWLLPTTYGITATPPSGNGYLTTSQNVNITGDRNLTMTLQQPVVLSGHVYDALGNTASGITVQLFSNNGQTFAGSTTTDGSGSYSVTVSPGTYTIFYTKPQGNHLVNFPTFATVFARNYILSQSTVLDITFPLKRVQVHVQDAFGNPINNIQFKTTSPNIDGGLAIGGGITNASGNDYYLDGDSSTDESGDAVLWLLPTTYGITATPPSGSGYLTSSQNVNITSDTNLIMTLIQPVVLSGHVYDALGNAALGISVQVFSNNGQTFVASTTTGTSGSYSFTLSSGTYSIQYSKAQGYSLANFPTSVHVMARNYLLNQNTVLDITFPLKRVEVHVQDAAGNPVSNVHLSTTDPNIESGLVIGGGITDVIGDDYYLDGDSSTDALGDAILWLLPATYGFTAIPPSGSNYNQFSINSTITTHQTLLISLQYNHATPATVIDLQTLHADGTYSNPTAVTLSATAASGYTIANIYYKVDGGSQQAYIAPFAVSGSGPHHIEYWSVDNSGVQESHKTKDFIIYVNQSPYVNPLSDVKINQNDTYTATGSFTDPDSNSWTATVDYGDGAGPENLPLNPDKIFNLNHQYLTAGVYTVTVVVKDEGQATGTTMATITVNAPPVIDPIQGATIDEGQAYSKNGSFTDSDSTSWTATVDYGFGQENLPLNPDHTFTLNHLYQDNGSYTVTVRLTDDQGAMSTQTAIVVVNNVNPSVSALTTSINPVQVDTQTTARATFTDLGVLDTHMAVFDWGDGMTSQGNITETNGSGSVSGDHIYLQAGIYTIKLRVTDKDGGEGYAPDYQYISVYNPTSQGLFSGANHFQSPVGAYTADPSLSGQVKFGVTSKYQNGVATGKVSMDFKAANFTFDSTALSVLVTVNGKATLMGTGKINGGGNYNFLVTGIAGDNDMIRFQITDSANNVIYDSQPGALITDDPTASVTGQVVIH